MCGRFSITVPWEDLEKRFGIDLPEELYRPRYNAAPSQEMLVVPQESPERAEFYRWGLIPSWSKDMRIGNRLINARAETIAERPIFKDPFKRHRCLVLADGFYEWDKKGFKRTPYRLTLKDEGPFAFAGIYDVWRDTSGRDTRSFSIITTRSNALIESIHDRMPVILSKRGERVWLDPDRSTDELKALLRPFPEKKMRMTRVSTLVNSPKNDVPAVIEPVEEADRGR